jgi:NAD(P)H-dependent FMN reductase
MRLLVFAASHRPESANRKLARLAADHLQAQGAIIDFAEYAEFDMPIYNDGTAAHGVPEVAQSFAKRAGRADGIVLCSPEYNWSYPGSIKNIIDWT